MMVIGFAISGCLAETRRWRHLSLVMVGVWIVGSSSMLFGKSFFLWFLSPLFLGTMMALGGGISLLIRPVREITVRQPRQTKGRAAMPTLTTKQEVAWLVSIVSVGALVLLLVYLTE